MIAQHHIPSASAALLVIFAALLPASCGGEEEAPTDTTPATCVDKGTSGATASCLLPTQSADHYVDQANLYFDTLDIDAQRDRLPSYSELVIRWEWPPWLLLTGFGRDTMLQTGDALRSLDPSTVPVRECRAFDVQPFARCYVVFEYEGGPCPIYEEFTFNDQGEMTFIEAWSDLPHLRPMSDPEDRWAEGSEIPRLSTRVPGLGNAEGLIDLESPEMEQAATNDPDVADLATRASDQWRYWFEAYQEAGDDFFARGCGW